MKRALYAGSFDPPTNGHMWVLEEGAKLFDELIVVIGQNPQKKGAWTPHERVEILKECCAHLPNVQVRHFDGRYLVRVAAELGARYLLRGLRNAADFAYEQSIHNVNRDLESKVQTVFLVTPRELAEVSSSTVRSMVGFEGWEEVVARYVPVPVLRRIKAARTGRFVLGITGSVGAGKSAVCRVLAARGWSVLDVDDVAAQALLEVLPTVAQKVPAVISTGGGLNKEPLFAAMLADPDFRQDLEKQLKPLVTAKVNHWRASLTGPGALEAALLFESGLEGLCDATLCIKCSAEERQRRVLRRSTASATHFDSLEAAQWPEARKLSRANFAISTEGPQEQLEAKLGEVLKALGHKL